MKKILLLCITVVLTLSLVGCGSVTVPDVSGMTEKEAKTALEELGFSIKTVKGYKADEEDGVVIAQKPAKDEDAEIGSEVKITLNDKESFGYNYEVVDSNAEIIGIKNGYVDVGSITVPSEIDGYKVISIADGAFWGIGGMTEITLPDTVTKIGATAFSDCYSLERVNMGIGLKTIGESAFSGCTGLKEVDIPSNVELIGSKAFAGCEALQSAKIGAKEIGSEAFSKCTGLASLKLTSSVKKIGDYAFYLCSAVNDINVPDSVNIVGRSAFEGCLGAERITVGSGLKDMGDFAFANCSGASDVVIKNGVTEISYCGFASLTVREIELPDSVKVIGENAFQYSLIKDVFIPSSIIEIKANAFYNCNDLVKVTVDNSASAVKIASDAFPVNFEITFTK